MTAARKPAPLSETPGARYEVIQAVAFSLDTDELVLDVDCTYPTDRQYRIAVRMGDDFAVTVRGHCAPGCMDALETTTLSEQEAYDLSRWLECDDDIASLFARWKLDEMSEAAE